MSDSIYILEISSSVNEDIQISPKKLFKTLPLYQFQYLMDTKQYEEAEKLAIQYNMDCQVFSINLSLVCEKESTSRFDKECRKNGANKC